MTGRSLPVALAFVWAIAVLAVGVYIFDIPVFLGSVALAFAFLPTGVVLLVRLVTQRLRAGQSAPAATPLDELLLALLTWPAILFLGGNDGPGFNCSVRRVICCAKQWGVNLSCWLDVYATSTGTDFRGFATI